MYILFYLASLYLSLYLTPHACSYFIKHSLLLIIYGTIFNTMGIIGSSLLKIAARDGRDGILCEIVKHQNLIIHN